MVLDKVAVHSTGMLFDSECGTHLGKSTRVVFPLESITIHCGNISMRQHKVHVLFLFYMELLTGQRPITTKSKASVAVFSVRKDTPAGAKVTLRADSLLYFYYLFVYMYSRYFRSNSNASFKSFRTYSILFPTLSDFGTVVNSIFDRHRNALWFTLNFSTSRQLTFILSKSLLGRYWFPLLK